MKITIYGTNWCDDTRRTRAFFAARAIRPTFVDIEARPHQARGLSIDGAPLRIPIVLFGDDRRLDEPTDAELEAAFADTEQSAPVRHRTALEPAMQRFEQYRDDVLVASADFVEQGNQVLITRTTQHVDVGEALAEENLQRLTAGLIEIAHKSGRSVDIHPRDADHSHPDRAHPDRAQADRAQTDPAPTPPEPVVAPPVHEPEPEPREPDVPDTVILCPLSQQFEAAWSSGATPAEAIRLATEREIGRLATIRALHAFWEMPLTPEAMTLAFADPEPDELAAMFHVLAWILQENPSATISELDAFDRATGISVKTHALSRAGRLRDAIAVVDRMGPGLVLHPISEDEAYAIAAGAIDGADPELRIQTDSTLRFPFGWLFLYQSAEYLETGDYSTMISGNAPLLVDRFTGALWVTGTAERPTVYVDNYLVTGDPLIAPSDR